MASNRNYFELVNDDTLIRIFALCTVPDILALRQTCKSFFSVTHLRTVWQNAFRFVVLEQGSPFPETPLGSMSTSELEQRIRRAHSLGQKWRSSTCAVNRSVLSAAVSTRVTDVRILPGHDGKLLLTTSTGVWSVIRIWDTSNGTHKKLVEWSSPGALLQGFAVNTDLRFGTALAVSTWKHQTRTIQILSLRTSNCSSPALEIVASLIPQNNEFHYCPMKFHGSLLALSDQWSETILWNWKDDTWASLQHPVEARFRLDRPIQVVFAHKSVLVIRASSLHLFPESILQSRKFPPPVFQPIAYHTWGRTDGFAAVTQPTRGAQSEGHHAPLSILVRGEADDPWSTEQPRLELYVLEPNPDFELVDGENATPSQLPYNFPPSKIRHVSISRGPLQCPTVILGRHGTAVWIVPRDPSPRGLAIGLDEIEELGLSNTSESLAAAAFFASMSPNEGKVNLKTLCTNPQNNWTSIDYDESVGRIVLGSSFGNVMILDL